MEPSGLFVLLPTIMRLCLAMLISADALHAYPVSQLPSTPSCLAIYHSQTHVNTSQPPQAPWAAGPSCNWLTPNSKGFILLDLPHLLYVLCNWNTVSLLNAKRCFSMLMRYSSHKQRSNSIRWINWIDNCSLYSSIWCWLAFAKGCLKTGEDRWHGWVQ